MQKKSDNPENQQKPNQSSQDQPQQTNQTQTKQEDDSQSGNNAATCAIAGCGGIALFLVVLILALIGGAAYIWYSNMFGVQEYADMYQKAKSGETQSIEDMPISDSQMEALKNSDVDMQKLKENPEQVKECVKEKVGFTKMMKMMSTQQISEEDMKKLEPCLK